MPLPGPNDWDARTTPLKDQSIPEYDVRSDAHSNKYLRSKLFRTSPFSFFQKLGNRKASPAGSRYKLPQIPGHQSKFNLSFQDNVDAMLRENNIELHISKLKTRVTQLILIREDFLQQIKDEIAQLGQSPKDDDQAASRVYKLVQETREASVVVVDKIMEWRKARVILAPPAAPQGLGPKPKLLPFLWKGENYLHTMLSDLGRLFEPGNGLVTQSFMENALGGVVTQHFVQNPFVLPITLSNAEVPTPEDLRRKCNHSSYPMNDLLSQKLSRAWAVLQKEIPHVEVPETRSLPPIFPNQATGLQMAMAGHSVLDQQVLPGFNGSVTTSITFPRKSVSALEFRAIRQQYLCTNEFPEAVQCVLSAARILLRSSETEAQRPDESGLYDPESLQSFLRHPRQLLVRLSAFDTMSPLDALQFDMLVRVQGNRSFKPKACWKINPSLALVCSWMKKYLKSQGCCNPDDDGNESEDSWDDGDSSSSDDDGGAMDFGMFGDSPSKKLRQSSSNTEFANASITTSPEHLQELESLSTLKHEMGELRDELQKLRDGKPVLAATSNNQKLDGWVSLAKLGLVLDGQKVLVSAQCNGHSGVLLKCTVTTGDGILSPRNITIPPFLVAKVLGASGDEMLTMS
jgi:hypothetical protein